MQQERKRIKMKGEQFLKSLKVVADAHQENINEVIDKGDLSYSDIVLHWGNGRHVFQIHGAKKALTLKRAMQCCLKHFVCQTGPTLP